MLSSAGKKRGASAVIKELESWHQKNLSKYKWLRGGIEVVDEVCFFFVLPLAGCVCSIESYCSTRSRNRPLGRY